MRYESVGVYPACRFRLNTPHPNAATFETRDEGTKERSVNQGQSHAPLLLREHFSG